MEIKRGYKQTEAGLIPENWKFDPLCYYVVSSAYGPRFSGELYSDQGNVALLRTTDLDDEGNLFLDQMPRARLSLDQFKSHLLLSGDFLVSRSGTCGISTIFPGFEIPVLPGAFLIRIRFTDNIHADYLKLYFNSEFGKRHLQQLTEGGVQKNIRGSALIELSFPIPPLPEQRAIATALSDMDGLLESLEQLIVKKRDLKQATMQQLLTAKTRLPGFSGKWKTKRFGDLVTMRRERTNQRTIENSDFCIELEHIGSNTGAVTGHTKTNENSSLKTPFCKGDILFGKLRAYLKKYWLADRSGVCSTEIWVFDTNASVVFNGYLYQIVRTNQFIEVASNSYGTHMPRSDWNIVMNYELIIPPLPEQTAIAAVLSDMDAELTTLEQRRDKTRALKQAMMQELLTGKTRLICSTSIK